MILVFIVLLSIVPQSLSETYVEPHVDPNKIGGRIDPISIVIIYFNVFERLQNMDFNTTLVYLEELNKTTIPEDIKLIMSRLNSLIQDLTILINKSVMELDNAEKYIKEGRIIEANKSLSSASIYIFKANNTLAEVKRAWIEFEKNIGRILPEDYRPRFSEYTAEISLLFRRLNKLLMELKQKQSKLRVEVEQALVMESEEQLNTSIIVYNYSYDLEPGGPFYVCGVLIDYFNNTLANKRIKIYVYVENTELAVYDTITNSNGLFCLRATVPEKYYGSGGAPVGKVKFNASIYVIYVPSKEEKFAGSSIVLPGVFSYIKTTIKVEGPVTAYPGSNVTFKVIVEPAIHGLQRRLLILLDGKSISNISISLTRTNIRVSIPYNISIGQHFLNFTLLGLGKYSPASYRTYIIIRYIPIYASIQYPQTYVYPLQQGLVVSGKIVDYNNNPIVNATVEALGYKTSTDSEGYFNLSIHLEKINIFGGPIEFNLTIKPNESWYPSINKTVRVNYVNLYIILGTALYIVLMISIPSKKYLFIKRISLSTRRMIIRGMTRTVRKQVADEIKIKGSSHKEAFDVKNIFERVRKSRYTETIKVSDTIASRFIPYAIRCSMIVLKYVKLIQLLEKKYGPMKRSETLWEYVKRLTSHMPKQVSDKLVQATNLIYRDCFSAKGLSDSERKLLYELINSVENNV